MSKRAAAVVVVLLEGELRCGRRACVCARRGRQRVGLDGWRARVMAERTIVRKMICRGGGWGGGSDGEEGDVKGGD